MAAREKKKKKKTDKGKKIKEVISISSVLRVKSTADHSTVLLQPLFLSFHLEFFPGLCLFGLQQFVNQLQIFTSIRYHPKNSYHFFHAENSITSENRTEVMIGRQMPKSTAIIKIDISKNVFGYTC